MLYEVTGSELPVIQLRDVLLLWPFTVVSPLTIIYKMGKFIDGKISHDTIIETHDTIIEKNGVADRASVYRYDFKVSFLKLSIINSNAKNHIP